MQVYCVGGAVRDELLGLKVQDRDYVVVGSTPMEMESAGYKPVGKDFPVFLHPQTHEEYALARTERKTGKGYKGFQVYAAPDISLEQDLARRDLTINAIAKDENGNLIDPYSGIQDLNDKLFRHVSDAFSEDPVRILRVARFAARFTNFEVAPETMHLMRKMVDQGEVDALVPERVWQEMSKGLMEKKPSRMFEVLRACGALQKIMPELNRLWGAPQPAQHHPEIDTGVHVMMVIDYAATKQYSLPVRFAALVHDLGKGTTAQELLPRHIGHEERSVRLLIEVCERLRVPNECKALAQIVAKFHGKVHQVNQMRPETLLKLLTDTDAVRQPDRFEDFLSACECDIRGRTAYQDHPFHEAALLLELLKVASEIDAGAIAKLQNTPESIKQAIHEARVNAISQALSARIHPV
jgi:tRNA nucleotidyltransferase (CCA-adding enzyme)